MTAFLAKRWFLVALAVLIPLGLFAGNASPSGGFEQWGPIWQSIWRRFPQIVTAIVLLLMAFSLDTHHLHAAVRAPGPVLWASLVNYGGIPLLAWSLAPLQFLPDFQIGLMVAATVPCTLAAASVWTRKANGNDAVSLMVTLLTNTLCFVLTPLWLNLTTGQGVTLDSGQMVMRLLIVVLIPTLAGQGLRQIPRLGALAVRQKTPIGVVAQSLILVLVFLAALRAGKQLGGEGPNPSAFSVIFVWATCILVHIAAMLVGWVGSGMMGFTPPNRAAIVFASSQKTLPIGVLIATDPMMLGNPNLLGEGLGIPFAVFPMLMYHASQLFIDTVVADNLAARAESK